MLNLISPIGRTFAGRLTPRNTSENLLAVAAPLALCVSACLCASGCVSSGATAASNNAQGVEYFSAGQYDKAIAQFQNSLQENPDSAETYYNLGSAYQRKANETGDLNLLSQAEDAYWTALELNPAPETIVCCYRGLATSQTARGDSAGAMKTLEEWRDRNPDSIEPKLEIAYLLEAQERDDDAYDALQEVAQAAPNDYRAYYKMGALSERAGDLEDAIERTNVAAKLKPDDADVAQRARNLEARYAAQQRESKQNVAQEEQPETEIAATTIPASQTARVQTASAQSDGETPPDMVLPDDGQTAPAESNAPADQDDDVSDAQPALGFGEVVVYKSKAAETKTAKTASLASARANRTNTTRFVGHDGAVETTADESKDDSDVKWISATAPKSAGNVAQTSATVPQKTTATPVQSLAAATKNLSTAAKTTSANLASNATQPTQTTARPATTAASAAATQTTQTKDRRTLMGGGMPSVRAGSLF